MTIYLYRGAGTVQMGLIVDAVEEVVNLTSAEIEPTPDFGAKIDTTYLLGMAKVKGQVKTLLDIDRVVAPEQMQVVAEAATEAAAQPVTV